MKKGEVELICIYDSTKDSVQLLLLDIFSNFVERELNEVIPR